jgi:hypothetical protein
VPDTAICDTLTLEFPVFEIVTVWLLVAPAFVLTKVSELGLADSCKVCAIPVPESASAKGELGALLTREREPGKFVAEVGVKLNVKAAELPGATERGKARPLSANPWPLSVACVTLRLAVPEFWMVIVWVLLVPTTTFPNATELGTTEIWGSTPVPLRLLVVGEFVALLLAETLPVMLPAVVGENATVSDALCPAVSVMGVTIPDAVKPAPVTVTWEMVTLLFPALAKVIVFELLVVPTSTLPKLKLVVLAVSWSVCAVPLPDKAIVAGELLALLRTETLPVTAPATVGENATVNVALCPAARVSGTAKPPAVNPGPVTDNCEIVTLLLPVFVNTTGCEPLPPTSTLPRFREVTLADSR